MDSVVDQKTPVVSVPPGVGTPQNPIGNESAVRVIVRLQHSGMNARRRSVITDAGTWSAVWQQVHQVYGSPPALPDVDFANEAVVLASMGTQRSGGYAIDIMSAAASEGRLRVVVRETSPGSMCGVTAALTAPVHIVRVPRTDGAPVFIEQSTTRSC